MDQYAKGINLMVPHAVWYDPNSGIMADGLYSYDTAYEGTFIMEYDQEDEEGYNAEIVCFSQGRRVY